MEIWREIKGFEGLYEVSNLGNIKSLARDVYTNGRLCYRKSERLLKPHKQRDHFSVVLCKDDKTYPRLVHRLVAESFIPNPDNKPVVDHIDTDPRNNKAENLRWVTVQENCLNPLTRLHNSQAKNGHKGYLTHHTEETKRKLSEALKGRKLTDEHKRRLSESHKSIGKGKTNNKLKNKHWKVEGGKRVWY